VRLATEDARRPFDVGRGPLVRARLVRLADDDSRLYLALHHAIFDGYSLYQVVVPELAALYAAALAGTRTPLPELPIQYADWAAWQRAEVERGAYARQLEHWTKWLADVPPVDLPGDRPRPPVLSYRGAMHAFTLPQRLGAALSALGARERVTLYMTLFAALPGPRASLHGQGRPRRRLGERRPQAPRGRAAARLLRQPLALRVDCSGDPSFVSCCAASATWRWRRCPTTTCRSSTWWPRCSPRATRAPPVLPDGDVARGADGTPAEGWDLCHLDVEMRTTKFDLYLEMNARPDGLGGRFVYATDLFSRETVARMAGHYANLLAAVVADPTRSLSALPMLGADERRRLLVDWAKAPTRIPIPPACTASSSRRPPARPTPSRCSTTRRV